MLNTAGQSPLFLAFKKVITSQTAIYIMGLNCPGLFQGMILKIKYVVKSNLIEVMDNHKEQIGKKERNG